MTQNFVSIVGLRQCLAFLATGNPDLVSGCLQEQRSGLHQRFLAALQAKCPEVRARLHANIQDRLAGCLQEQHLHLHQCFLAVLQVKCPEVGAMFALGQSNKYSPVL